MRNPWAKGSLKRSSDANDNVQNTSLLFDSSPRFTCDQGEITGTGIILIIVVHGFASTFPKRAARGLD